jgi:acyl carrier protein
MMTREEMFGVIKGNMEAVIEGARGRQIAEQQSMRDFGADSLEIVEVVSRSMKQCRRKVRRTDLAEVKNLGELLDLLEKAPEIVAVPA